MCNLRNIYMTSIDIIHASCLPMIKMIKEKTLIIDVNRKPKSLLYD
jgi:hypothetical protein